MAPDLRPQDAPASGLLGLGAALRPCGDTPDGCGAAAAARDPRLPGNVMGEVMRLRGGAPEGGGAPGGDAFGVGASVEVRARLSWAPNAFWLSQSACLLHRSWSSGRAPVAVLGAASLSRHHDC